MRQGRASRTAEHNALFRALESSLPADRRLFEDPLAAAFLGGSLSLVERLARLPGLRGFVPWFIDRRWPGVRTSVVARMRLIDGAIASRDFLAERGLALESDLGAAQFRKRYYGEAARGMRGHEFYRVALARVAPDRARRGVPLSQVAAVPRARG